MTNSFRTPKSTGLCFAVVLSALLTGCAPSPTQDSGEGSKQQPATTETISTVQPAFRGSGTSVSLEFRAKEPPKDFKLPWPDATPAVGIETGKQGGRFTTVSFGEGPKTFNPITSNDASSAEIIGRMFDGLIGFNNETQEYFPQLLKEWYMENPKTWILRLRSGLKWSDGKPITADDIIFTMKLIYDPQIPNPARDSLQIGGKPIEMEKVDDLTVRAKLAAPTGVFHAIIGIAPIPKHIWEESYKSGTFIQTMNINVAPETIVCSGPFKLKRYDSGERVVLDRNTNYYKYDKNGVQLPYLDELVFTYVPDQDAMLLRFQRGEADGVVQPKPESIPDMMNPEAQKKGNYKLYDLGPGEGGSYLWLNLKQGNNKNGKPYVNPVKEKWFQDEKFRKAIYLAMDRESVVRTELRGLAVLTASIESPANHFWYNPDVVKYPYDAKMANQLLDEAGFKDRDSDGVRKDRDGNKVSFTFITNKGNKVRERAATLMSQDLAKVGIDMRPQFIDFNALVTQTADTFEYEACCLGLTGGGIHPINSMNVYRSSGHTHLWNPRQEKPATPWESEIDHLADEFSTAIDIQKQQEIYYKIQLIVSQNVPIFPLWSSKIFVAVRNGFGNVKPTALSPQLLWNIEEIFVKR